MNIQTFDLNTKPGRKVQIANIPLHLNVSIKDLKEFIFNELIRQNYIDKNERNILFGNKLIFKNFNEYFLFLVLFSIIKYLIFQLSFFLLSLQVQFI